MPAIAGHLHAVGNLLVAAGFFSLALHLADPLHGC
jgi:hypothetical protein